ncbi:hypothetical protein [Actinoplanes regularis]|uniref:hypothetical protein n=1 Tax=Actinoplanes regularis TaxID=52697 RepID=UPI003D7F766B
MVAEGGSGNDTLSGGSNSDRLFGGTGNDKLSGAAATTRSFSSRLLRLREGPSLVSEGPCLYLHRYPGRPYLP